MTTKERQSTTEPRHWSNKTAAAAVQAAIEAQALMLATALALGLPDERVEDAPQEAERLRTHLAQIRAILTGLLVDADIETTDDVVRLAVQVRAQVRALEAERDELVADRAAIVELLLATGVEPASGDPVQLAAQVAEWVRELRDVAKAAAELLDMLDTAAEGESADPDLDDVDGDSATEKLWRALRAVGMEP